MKNQKKSLIEWIKAHKKELILAGVSVVVLIAIVLGLKNKAAIEAYWSSLKQLVKENASTPNPITHSSKVMPSSAPTSVNNDNIIPFTKAAHKVSEHIRTLPNGYNASASKIALAKEKVIELLPGQTIVSAYVTGGIVA